MKKDSIVYGHREALKYAPENTIISSFNHHILQKIKEIIPDIITAPLYGSFFIDIWKYAESIGAGAVHPYFPYITTNVVKGCNENNILINTWTIDEERDIKKIIELGVDGIISYVPDITLKILNKLNE